jgi:hypothetical protein
MAVVAAAAGLPVLPLRTMLPVTEVWELHHRFPGHRYIMPEAVAVVPVPGILLAVVAPEAVVPVVMATLAAPDRQIPVEAVAAGVAVILTGRDGRAIMEAAVAPVSLSSSTDT